MRTQQTHELRYFLSSQQLADGLRITAAILLPAVVLYQFGMLALGMSISLGALSVSLSDAPGPIVHRKNGMLITAAFSFLVALITAFAHANVYTMGLEVVVAVFFFSLLQVYGIRASSVGNAAILIMILTMGSTSNTQPVLHSFFILAGGLWYTGMALLFYHLRPYRPAQRALGDCIRAMAEYLSIKALFYNPGTNLQEAYSKLVAQQVEVNEKQNAVREIFFKTARIVNETTPEGKRLVAAFVQTVDLFEAITATYYNYSSLRKRFEQRHILLHIAGVITQLALELDRIGIGIQTARKPTLQFHADAALVALKEEIDAIKKVEPEENTLILKKILVNIRRMAQHLTDLNRYFEKDFLPAQSNVDHTQFIGHQSLDSRLLWNNLNMQSTAFKHSVRIAVACLVGFSISKLLAYGQHSYWILLTIAFILKPAFSLTKTRNIERIWGTITGGIFGVLILYFIHNTRVHFVLMVLLMLANYTFMRTKYVVMVFCSTAYILILFQFLDIPFITVVQERLFDTVLGCVIAFSAGYFLFPDWEAHQIKNYMADMLLANAAYLQKATESLEGKAVDNVAYKLARKAVYVQSANLSAAFQRMAAEPKRQQYNNELMQQFLVRNHLLFSNIAHLTTLLNDGAPRPACRQAAQAQQAVYKLYGISKKLGVSPPVAEQKKENAVKQQPEQITAPNDALLQPNVDFIVKLCDDICKTTEAILAA